MKVTITPGIDPTLYENRTNRQAEVTTPSVPAGSTAASGQAAQTTSDGKTFAETLFAIDKAIASSRKEGGSGIGVDTELARMLGIVAFGSNSGYNLASRGTTITGVNGGMATDAYTAKLATLTSRYSNYTRDMMAYDGTPAAAYGGDLECSDELNAYFDEAAKTYNVNVKLLKSVAKAESSFRADAVSKAGAQGIMQLMPTTASGLGVTDSFDPKQNIMGGAKYLGALLDTFHGDASLAVAGYNAGGARVKQYNGIPPFSETRGYVVKVLGYYEETPVNADMIGSLAGNKTVEQLTAEIRAELTEEIRAELTEELQETLREQIRTELEDAIREELESEMKDLISEAVKDAVADALKELEANKTEAAEIILEEVAPEEVTPEGNPTVDSIPEEILEDVPMDAPIETQEETISDEDELTVSPVTETETTATE